MNILKDKTIIADSWQHISDQESAPESKYTVTLNRWNQNLEADQNNIHCTGIRLNSEDQIDSFSNEDIRNIELIILEFPAFTDGRIFSQARLLRDQFKYSNEIRAKGNFMPDQVFYLSRVGVNAFEFDNQDDLEAAQSTLDDFSVAYQTSSINFN